MEKETSHLIQEWMETSNVYRYSRCGLTVPGVTLKCFLGPSDDIQLAIQTPKLVNSGLHLAAKLVHRQTTFGKVDHFWLPKVVLGGPVGCQNQPPGHFWLPKPVRADCFWPGSLFAGHTRIIAIYRKGIVGFAAL